MQQKRSKGKYLLAQMHKCINYKTHKEEYKKFEPFRIDWIVFVHHSLVSHSQ